MKKFETEVRLSREMTLMDATLIGVGAMIGAGIFVLIGIAAGVAGPALILAFAFNGLVALLTAMSYAELGSCYHDAGGGYLWVKEGLPKWNGFLSGWMSWFAHAVACSLYALGFGAYFDYVLREVGLVIPQWGFLSPQKTMAALMAVLFAYINFRGASETGKVGNIVTMTKIVILALFIGLGLHWMLKRGDWLSAFQPFLANGWGGVFKAMGLTFIAFQGFEVIAQSSEEIKNPKKNIPRAVLLSLLIVVPIYLLVATAALGSVQPASMTPWDYLALHKETALVEVARHFFSGGGVVILVGGLISTLSALNATIYSSSRVAFAMGRDRNFPAFFSKVHSRNFTPHWSILVSLVIIVTMAVSLPIEDVASAADIMFLLLFLQVNVAMIQLRRKRPDLDRGFFVPLFPWLSVAAILMLLFLALYMFQYSLIAWISTGLWISLGLIVYQGYASKREIEHVRKIKSLERIERKDYSILVCLGNPDAIASLSQLAFAIARKNNGELIFLHVIEVHEGQQLAAGLDDISRVRPALDGAVRTAVEAGIPARSLIKVSHRISQGIVDTAAEEEANFIIIGRDKRPTFLDRVFSSVIDTVFQKAPTEIAVLHGDLASREIKRILIPFGASIHTNLAAEIAPALSEHFKAEISIAVVFEPETSKSQREAMLDGIHELLNKHQLNASVETVMGRDVLRGIVRKSADADLILMGGRSGDFLELLLAPSLTQEITERSRCPVVWLKEYEEKGSLWSSLWIAHAKEARHD
jgi:amino acid transporter/nucleotide-binding universal stress UspA family protein